MLVIRCLVEPARRQGSEGPFNGRRIGILGDRDVLHRDHGPTLEADVFQIFGRWVLILV